MRKKPDHQQAEFLRSIVEYNVRAVVEHEDQVRVECEVMPSRVVMTIYTAPSDVGLALGTEGATANAIRRILWTACKKTNLRADIDFFTSGRR